MLRFILSSHNYKNLSVSERSIFTFNNKNPKSVEVPFLLIRKEK